MKVVRRLAKWILAHVSPGWLRARNKTLSKPRQFAEDDYDWRTYHIGYRKQLLRLEESYAIRLSSEDYRFTDGCLVQDKSRLQLHPNHRLLYETILLLKPASVVEAGCGGGDHLHNLQILAPELELTGFDRSPEQLAMLRERSPNLKARIEQLDLTLPYSDLLPQADLVFTQAVIMHIKTGNGHLVALSSLFKMARNQVVLMENWNRHNFHTDIVFLHAKKMIPWPQLHSYFRRVPEWGNRPHLVIISRTPLGYEELPDDRTLVEQTPHA